MHSLGSKYTKMHLWPSLRLDLLGEFTALPRTLAGLKWQNGKASGQGKGK